MATTVESVKQKVKNNIDTKLLVTGVATVVVIGVGIAVFKKLGKHGRQIAKIIEGGK